MNIDFHVHGLLSKRKDFNEVIFMEEIRSAKLNNLDGFILCEHYNAINFLQIHEFLSKSFPYHGDRYIVDGISVFPGIEVSIKGKGHVIIAGNREAIINLHKILLNHMTKDNLIEFSDLLDYADANNCIKIGAHPYRKAHKLYTHPEEVIKRLDAIDYNGKDIFKNGEIETLSQLQELSQRIGVNIVTGSDSHTPLQLGSVLTTLNRECATVAEIKECIYENDYSIHVSKSLIFKIFTSKILKRYLICTRTYCKNTDFRL